MEKTIVGNTSADMRKVGQNTIEGRWLLALIATGIYWIITSVIPEFLSFFIGNDILYETNDMQIAIEWRLVLYSFIVTGPFVAGLCSFFLHFFNHKEKSASQIFFCFCNGKRLVKSVILYLIRWILTYGPTMLIFCSFIFYVLSFVYTKAGTSAPIFSSAVFVIITVAFIVGSIASVAYAIYAKLKYSQVFFLLAKDDNLPIFKLLKESTAIMQGNKLKLFIFSLSFAGWWLGSVLPGIVVSFLCTVDGIYSLVDVIIVVIASFPVVVFRAYFMTGMTCFHEIASSSIRIRPLTEEKKYSFINDVSATSEKKSNE